MTLFSVHVPTRHGKGESKKSVRERRRREELFKKQEGKCFWCGDLMELNHFHVTQFGRTKENAAFASFEHLIPKSHGGLSGFVNIVLAHAGCNNTRPRKQWPHDPIFGPNAKLTPMAPKPQRSPRRDAELPEKRNRIKTVPISQTMDILGRSRMLTKVGIEPH